MAEPIVAIPDAAATEPLTHHQARHAMVEVLSALLSRSGAKAVTVDPSDLSTEAHFFDDLGANSMTMAHFCAKLRKQPGFPGVSMRDIYANPSIDQLAFALVPVDEPLAPVAPTVVEPEPVKATTAAVAVCGLAQVVSFIVYSYLVALVAIPGYTWISEAGDLLTVYLRSLIVGGGLFLGVCLLPIVAKWVLVGRWTETEFPLWSPAYFRFWLVKALLHVNPMILFVGNPIFVFYLRALGAKIGPGVSILSRSIPACPDLLTVGAGAVVRKDSLYQCYRAAAGLIQTGPVTIGPGAFVGEKTVLDIGTEIGPDGQLGHSSSLQQGERVPAGRVWHGAPAVPTDLDYQRVQPLPAAPGLRAAYVLGSLAQTFLITLPVAAGGAYLVVSEIPRLHALVVPGLTGASATAVRALTLALTLAVGLAVIMAVFVFALPRLMARLVRPYVSYPMYGFHYSLHRTVQALTNRRLLMWLFGDSSYVTGYLSRLGYDLGTVEQTGSNFGTEVQHETPYLVRVGGGTMVADGLSLLNADYSASSFRLVPAELGSHSFLGNNIAYPAGARIGDNCLLATKVMVPLDGPVRSNVGLLGSPPFEIPRTVERDSRFDYLRGRRRLRHALRAKDRANRRSMIIMSGLRVLHLFGLSLLGLALLDLGPDGLVGQLLLALYAPASLFFTTAFWVLVERLICRFRPLTPQLRSIYDPYFFWHERLWKVPDRYLDAFNGTPVKTLVWRLLGVRIGARVFDDGAFLTERTLVSIGDDAVLNVGSKVQSHSQEDGTFKSDHTHVGARVTLGVGAFIHYGVTLGDGCTVTADSFLMKGEEVPERARWGGNPASPTPSVATASPVVAGLSRSQS